MTERRNPVAAPAVTTFIAGAATLLLALLLGSSPARGADLAAAEPTHAQVQAQAQVQVQVQVQPDESEHAGQAEEAGHANQVASIDPKKLALQFLNFAVLLFILIKFGGGAINKALAARHQQLKADLASAAELRAIAEANLARQETRLASLETEIADMRRGIKAEAEAEKARLVAAAEERALRIKAETTFLVDQQVRDAEARLRRESADAALKMAEEILRRAIGTADQHRLLDTFVTDVEQISTGASKGPGRMS